jgi:hypothetical protein
VAQFYAAIWPLFAPPLTDKTKKKLQGMLKLLDEDDE